MGVNTDNIPVIKPWVCSLSWKEQTVLLSALRGCDGVGKNDISKKIIRRVRNTVLHNAGPDGSEFMDCDISDEEIYGFGEKNLENKGVLESKKNS